MPWSNVSNNLCICPILSWKYNGKMQEKYEWVIKHFSIEKQLLQSIEQSHDKRLVHSESKNQRILTKLNLSKTRPPSVRWLCLKLSDTQLERSQRRDKLRQLPANLDSRSPSEGCKDWRRSEGEETVGELKRWEALRSRKKWYWEICFGSVYWWYEILLKTLLEIYDLKLRQLYSKSSYLRRLLTFF